jgi:hypothetical protein
VRSRERLLVELGRRGARGGIITLHRAMVGERFTGASAASMLLLAPALAVLTALALRPLGFAWTWAFRELHPFLRLPGDVAVHTIAIGPLPPFDIPYLTTPATPPLTEHWILVGTLAAIALVVSLGLPRRMLPLAYYLRFVGVVQATSFVFFAIAPDAFPYPLPEYLLGLFQAGAAMLVLIPIGLGLFFFPFDVGLPRKATLAVLVVAHTAVLLPLQMLLHAYLIHHLSLLVMPPLFFFFGMMLEVFVFIGFYGWGMSWRRRREARA